MSESDDSFVYDGIEVRKTGRVAARKIGPAGNREQQLVEIEPIDKIFEWKKWVDPLQLFIIQK